MTWMCHFLPPCLEAEGSWIKTSSYITISNFHLLLWLLTSSNLLLLLHSWSSCPWFTPVTLCPFFLTLALSLSHVYAYLLLSRLMCVQVCTKFYIPTLRRSPCCPFYHIFELQFMVKQESPDLAYLTRFTHCPINYTHISKSIMTLQSTKDVSFSLFIRYIKGFQKYVVGPTYKS